MPKISMIYGFLQPIHLEILSGKLEGYHSIRINKQWRIIFKWENETAFKVQIVDYH